VSDIKQTEKAAGSIQRPTYKVERKHVSPVQGKIRIGKEKSGLAVALSETFSQERSFVQNMLRSLVDFVEGKSVMKPFVIENISAYPEPLRLSNDDVAVVDDPDEGLVESNKSSKSKAKKVGMSAVPFEEDVYRLRKRGHGRSKEKDPK